MNTIEPSGTEALQIKNIHTETLTDHGKHLQCQCADFTAAQPAPTTAQ